jgi:hypothetical protein
LGPIIRFFFFLSFARKMFCSSSWGALAINPLHITRSGPNRKHCLLSSCVVVSMDMCSDCHGDVCFLATGIYVKIYKSR